MSATKHTPGPWEVTGSGDIVTSNGIVIAWTNVLGGMEEEANARLIAAAPDLFDALLTLTTVVRERVTLDATSPEIRAAESAIAKATGEAS